MKNKSVEWAQEQPTKFCLCLCGTVQHGPFRGQWASSGGANWYYGAPHGIIRTPSDTKCLARSPSGPWWSMVVRGFAANPRLHESSMQTCNRSHFGMGPGGTGPPSLKKNAVKLG